MFASGVALALPGVREAELGVDDCALSRAGRVEFAHCSSEAATGLVPVTQVETGGTFLGVCHGGVEPERPGWLWQGRACAGECMPSVIDRGAAGGVVAGTGVRQGSAEGEDGGGPWARRSDRRPVGLPPRG